jgi:hypothetical protein
MLSYGGKYIEVKAVPKPTSFETFLKKDYGSSTIK